MPARRGPSTATVGATIREAFDRNDALVGRVLVSPALMAAALLDNVMPGAPSRWVAVSLPARERSV